MEVTGSEGRAPNFRGLYPDPQLHPGGLPRPLRGALDVSLIPRCKEPATGPPAIAWTFFFPALKSWVLGPGR